MKNLNQYGKAKIAIALWAIFLIGFASLIAKAQVSPGAQGLGVVSVTNPKGNCTPGQPCQGSPTPLLVQSSGSGASAPSSIVNFPTPVNTSTTPSSFLSSGPVTTYDNIASIGGTPVAPVNTPLAGGAPGILPVVAVPTQTTPGVATTGLCDLNGRQIFIPYAPLASWKTASGSVSTATTVAMIAKVGALNNTILGISIAYTSAVLASETAVSYVISNGVTILNCASQAVSTAGGIGTFADNCVESFPIACGNNPVSLTLSAAVTQCVWSVSYVQDN